MSLQKLYILMFALIFTLFIGCSCSDESTDVVNEYGLPFLPSVYNPSNYYCATIQVSPIIDGMDLNKEWESVAWSELFVSCVDAKVPAKKYASSFKMAYCNDSIYFLVKINESHIWAANSICGSPYLNDNFLKVYIDSNNDEFDYLVIKVNAFGRLCAEYCNVANDQPIHRISLIEECGARSKVFVDGTLNNSGDIDKYWQAEFAIPINIRIKDKVLLTPSSCWKLNVERTQWQTVIVAGIYKKVIDPSNGELFCGESWDWSNMWGNKINKIELWGDCIFPQFVQGDEISDFARSKKIKWELRNVFYAQHLHHKKHGRYANKIAGLKDVGFDLSALHFKPKIKVNKGKFIASIIDSESDYIWFITSQGRLSSESYKKR